MNHKICKLPEFVINQIAAGEVVENPASIVKELIENSLDAGSRWISIEIIAGGQQLIKIEDDGCGMGSADAIMCLERHATSKIREVSDLETLSTMGFRGEALAAIASVSQFELKTSNGIGTRVVAEGGNVVLVEPCARNRGTTIEVKSLFYNTPARKKFQKSVSASAAQVGKVVELIALAHPDVTFNFNGREFSQDTQKNRIAEILEDHEHFFQMEGLTVYLAAPHRAMATRMGQYVYINKRPIFSPLIAKAVKAGYGTRIAENAYPRFVLFLEVSSDGVDVNVHPQKKEVRFSDEGKIFRLVQRTVEKAFESKVEFQETVSFTPTSFTSFSESFLPSAFKFEKDEVEFKLEFKDYPLTMLGNYLLLRRENLILVDIRSAHARILFESLQDQDKLGSQALIWPLEFPISSGVEELAHSLNQIGIECRALKKMLVIDSLPACLEAAHFPEFLSEWKEGKKLEEITSKFCRAIKKIYLLDEAIAIWKELQRCKDMRYDPSGKVIWKEIREEHIWNLFESKE